MYNQLIFVGQTFQMSFINPDKNVENSIEFHMQW